MKARSLQDLQAIQRKLAEDRQRIATEQAARQQALQRAHAEKNLFTRAAGAVRPLPSHGRVVLAPQPPKPVAVQQQLDDQRVLREAISDAPRVTCNSASSTWALLRATSASATSTAIS